MKKAHRRERKDFRRNSLGGYDTVPLTFQLCLEDHAIGSDVIG